MASGKAGQESTHLPKIFRFIVNGKIETAYTIYTFPWCEIKEFPTVRKYNITYYNVPCAFDIETTNIKCDRPYAFMYHWQFCINDIVIFGRTWRELCLFFDRLAELLGLCENKKLVIYVHNLAFEFQFLMSVLDFNYVFARKIRKPIIARSEFFEFRCSYILSNMSLNKLCENSKGVTHYKQGNYNYNKYRDSSTPMHGNELAYCFCDVKGLAESIQYRMEEDTLATIPATSTGYVRRDVRALFKQDTKWKKQQLQLAMDIELHRLCREAFRGGDTHANALYSGMILDEVYSADEQSSYPGAMMIDKYPMSPFKFIDPRRINNAIKKGYAVIMRVHFHEIRLRGHYGITYIPMSHCRGRKKVRLDNGRVLSAEDIEITITDIDWKIICKDYKFEYCNVGIAYISEYGYLPEPLRLSIRDYFFQKTTLKGIEEKAYEYMKSKNRINGIYGMMVTDIISDDVKFVEGAWELVHNTEERAIELLEKFYKSRNSFLSYQWGIWVTANARWRLRRMIWKIGDDIVYVDTDSVKFLNRVNFNYIEEENLYIKEISLDVDIEPFVDYNGKRFQMPLWEIEHNGEPFRFRTWGAKKYITKCRKSRPEITVAGVDKKAGSNEIYWKARNRKCDPLELFKPGFVFEAAHHSTAYYNGGENSNVAILNGNYTLGVTGDYQELIFNNLVKK